MKKTLAISVASVSLLASLAAPAFAAPHRAPVTNDTMARSEPPGDQVLARPSDVVITDGRVVGADPDPNIRTQLLRDLGQGGF